MISKIRLYQSFSRLRKKFTFSVIFSEVEKTSTLNSGQVRRQEQKGTVVGDTEN